MLPHYKEDAYSLLLCSVFVDPQLFVRAFFFFPRKLIAVISMYILAALCGVIIGCSCSTPGCSWQEGGAWIAKCAAPGSVQSSIARQRCPDAGWAAMAALQLGQVAG